MTDPTAAANLHLAVGDGRLRRKSSAWSSTPPNATDFKAYDALAIKLESSGDDADATKHLLHPDVVVRLRAVEIIAKKKPELLVKDAERLLASENDQIRYLVCDALAKAGKSDAKDALTAILKDPGASKNPNVLRMRAVKALATYGDASSIDTIAPFAQSGAYLYGLTSESAKAIHAIGERDPKAKALAIGALVLAFPQPPDAGKAASEMAACKALAKTVHEALEKLTKRKVDFPSDYTVATREGLSDAWRKSAAR